MACIETEDDSPDDLLEPPGEIDRLIALKGRLRNDTTVDSLRVDGMWIGSGELPATGESLWLGYRDAGLPRIGKPAPLVEERSSR